MNVHEATISRLEFLFKEFDKIFVSFSGGKDSGVMLNVTLDFATRIGQLGKVSVYHMDYEAQYRMTTDYVQRTFDSLPAGVGKWWTCLPVKVPCCTSMFQSFWQPWRLEDKGIWCRELPEGSVSESNFPFTFDYDCTDYDYNIRFAKEVSKDAKTCFLIGIRSQESLHRYKAVNKVTDKNEYKSKNFTSRVSANCYNAYPIYDWKVEDVWTANARFGYDYNRLYDLFHQAGIEPSDMRVASPFITQGISSLKLYKVIDPDNWGKLVGRVNGVNFSGLYGDTTAMGWNSITKPAHFTWKDYMYFLLDTLPEQAREMYMRKLRVSFAYWLEKGGALPLEVVGKLDASLGFEDLGTPTDKRNRSTEYRVVKFKEYLDEVEMDNPNLLPTYKRMCIAIMKNDTSCKTLGFGQTRDELARRTAVMEKYRNL